MINANELRIGNVVSDINASISYYAKVKRLEANRCYYGAFHSQYNDLTPIPITKEWLLKLGFRESESNLRKGNIIIRFGENDRLIITLIDQIVLPKIQYIHQLQNLYFALTQTELELKS